VEVAFELEKATTGRRRGGDRGRRQAAGSLGGAKKSDQGGQLRSSTVEMLAAGHQTAVDITFFI
jgi:hypothetical protein